MGRHFRWTQDWTICVLAALTAGAAGSWQLRSASYAHLMIVKPPLAATVYEDHASARFLLGNTDPNVATLYYYQPSHAGYPS
jgi:hypothetical protein